MEQIDLSQTLSVSLGLILLICVSANTAQRSKTNDSLSAGGREWSVVRVYFGVGGPNYTASFHVIGEIFDRVYSMGSLTAAPLSDVQTITTPPGGAAVVDFKLEVPGRYVLVDHALSRVERGLAGILEVEGPDTPSVFQDPTPQRAAQAAGGH
ncbi:hypothetical protein [Microvirga massiliensis]|uniref:hypothetical protein n=1 Tax=Microvirga massiliensis TaxID=1033741 RepID=UPI001FCD60DD|nr:hypothetical protein [Microvirga massiliensis]